MTDPTVAHEGASVLNRRWLFEVNTGTTAEPVWSVIPASTDRKFSVEGSAEDDSDRDSEWTRTQVTSLSWSAEDKLRRAVNTTTGLYPVTHELLREAGRKIGADNYVELRISEVHSGPRTEAYTGVASVKWVEDGGGREGLATVTVTYTGVGPLTEIAHPYPHTPVDPEPEE